MDIRNIEKAWRVAWMRAIGDALPGPRPANGESLLLPRTDGRPLRVLFVRYERIGDMIMSTGMIRVLATSHPAGTSGVELDVLANPTTRPVLENNPHIRRVFTLNRQSWQDYWSTGRLLRRERYDVIINGRINNPLVFTSTPLLMWMARAPYRVGVSGGNNDRIYNVRVHPYDRSTHYIEGSKALAVPFGVDVDAVDWRPEIFLNDDERAAANAVWERAIHEQQGEGARLLVNLSASEPKRRWHDAHFVSVLRAVRAQHPRLPIVVMGLPSEWERVQHVATAVGAHAAPTPALRQALALVGTSDRVFTPDTSISHAASAFAKPAVVLLKRDHHPYAPWQIPGEIVFWDGETIHGLPEHAVQEPVLRLIAGV